MSSTTKQSSLLGLYAMNGGEGEYRYTQNSSYQVTYFSISKQLLYDDFGCSTGHNSFPAIEIITQAIEKRLLAEGLTTQNPEFHVFFNDQLVNDFNTLFQSLPPQRNFHAAGVPGSFHDHLFPKAFLHFAYSSCALNWFSEVPEAVEDHMHPAWNEGKIHYAGAKQEVFEAYSNQFAHDVESFLEARADELVIGGLMALLVPADPASKNSGTSFTYLTEMGVLGSCLMDMAKKGIFNEEKVDTFNLSLYYTNPQELKAIIEKNSSFRMERMEILYSPGKCTLSGAKARATVFRAVFEVMLTNHFGSDVMVSWMNYLIAT